MGYNTDNMGMHFRNVLCKRNQDPKDYTLHDFIYMKEKLIYDDKNKNIGVYDGN